MGIIPACAGSTVPAGRISPSCRDHPRMCGEHCCTCALMPAIVGSSPHVRGALSDQEGTYQAIGIIPACAGSTAPHGRTARPKRDHPRMCGEHSFNIHQFAGEQGSSPHVRGARSGGSSVSLLMGIIPACAGSTKGAFGIQGRHWDHPRMCGEHALNEMKIPREVGSSPHVRGARGSCVVPERVGGIIPACAGSTKGSMTVKSTLRDHPRMCGEHDPPCWSLHVFQGSSPHVRGAPKGRSGSKDGTGIIPACAGSTP